MMSPDLIQEATALGFYSKEKGAFHFSKVFSDDYCLEGRYKHGRRMLQEYSKEGK